MTSVVFTLSLTSETGWAMGKKTAPTGGESSGTSSPVAADRVWVSRPDGGLSCEADKAESVEKGAKALKSMAVEVFESRKSGDGKMHIEMCGAATGNENGYLIRRSDLDKAKALGFKPSK